MKIGPLVFTTVGELHHKANALSVILGTEKVMPGFVLLTRLITGETSIEKLASLQPKLREEYKEETNGD